MIRRAELPGSSDDELRWLWQRREAYDRAEPDEGKRGTARKYRGPFGPFVQILVLTGQRRTEVAKMEWRRDRPGPAPVGNPRQRAAKNGEPHLVPLSEAAIGILEALPHIKSKAGYVFTTDGEHAINGFSRMKQRIDKLMAEAAKDESSEEVAFPHWTLHDLRRTVAAGLQRLKVKMEVTEKLLNHTSGSFGGIVGVYQVYDYDDEKRSALQAWGSFVTSLVESKPDNVLEFKREVL